MPGGQPSTTFTSHVTCQSLQPSCALPWKRVYCWKVFKERHCLLFKEADLLFDYCLIIVCYTISLFLLTNMFIFSMLVLFVSYLFFFSLVSDFSFRDVILNKQVRLVLSSGIISKGSCYFNEEEYYLGVA